MLLSRLGQGARESSVNGLKVPELFDYRHHTFMCVGGSSNERDARRLSWTDMEAPPQTKDRIQHRTRCPGQKGAGFHGCGVGGRAAATKKAHAVGFIIKASVRRVV